MKQYDVESGVRPFWTLIYQGKDRSGKDVFTGHRKVVDSSVDEVRYGSHSHPDFLELFYLKRGQGILVVNGEKFELNMSKIFVVEPKDVHELIKPYGSPIDIEVWTLPLIPR